MWPIHPWTAVLQLAFVFVILQPSDSEQWPLLVCSSPIETRGGTEITTSFKLHYLSVQLEVLSQSFTLSALPSSRQRLAAITGWFISM